MRSPLPFLVFTTVRQQLSELTAAAGCGYAVWRGGRPERIFGMALLAGWLTSPFLVDSRDWTDPQWTEAALDAALLALALWQAFTSDRYWPMWAAAFMGLVVLMHLTMIVDPRVPPWSYRTASAVWSYLLLITLVAGTALEVRGRPRGADHGRRRWRIWRSGRS